VNIISSKAIDQEADSRKCNLIFKHSEIAFVKCNFLIIFFYFPTVQQGGQVILTCIHYNYIFPPPFLLLQHEYLDKVLNAIQQDLLVNLF